jgi:hypothetical protein
MKVPPLCDGIDPSLYICVLKIAPAMVTEAVSIQFPIKAQSFRLIQKQCITLRNLNICLPSIMFELVEVPNMNTVRFQTFVADVHELPIDLKRVLKVQFREFIHFVEDAEDGILIFEAPVQADASNLEAA